MKKLILLFLSISALSCSTDDYTKEGTAYSEFITANAIETEINFMPEEIYDTNEVQNPSLKLKLISSEFFTCGNYSLSTTQFTRRNELIIRLDEVSKPEICLLSGGSAISYVDLPLNTDKVTFINGNEIDRYSVVINQEKISLTTIEKNFTSSLFDKTFRIPENSFVYVCGTNTDNTNIYSDFSAILKQNPDFEEFEFKGEGRIPYPEMSDGHWADHPSKYYKYSNGGEFKGLGSILNQYSSENIKENAGVSISIYSWNNITFHSWMEN